MLHTMAKCIRICTEKNYIVHPPWDARTYTDNIEGKTKRSERFIADVLELIQKEKDLEARSKLRDSEGKIVCTFKMHDETKGFVPSNLVLIPPKVDVTQAQLEKKNRVAKSLEVVRKEIEQTNAKIAAQTAVLGTRDMINNDIDFDEATEILIVVRNRATGREHEIDIGQMNHLTGASLDKHKARDQVMQILNSITKTDMRIKTTCGPNENRFRLEEPQKNAYLEMLSNLCNILQSTCDEPKKP